VSYSARLELCEVKAVDPRLIGCLQGVRGGLSCDNGGVVSCDLV
jgi:hypothetical protein